MPATAHIANALTAARLLATPLFIFCIVRAATAPIAGWAAGLLFAFAAWSDIVDGRLARRHGTASDRGRVLDHFADIAFILGSLAAYAYLDMTPWWVPASIAASFSVYVIDSWLRSAPVKPTLIGSRIGHLGGIANWVLLGVLTFNESAGLQWLPTGLVAILFALVPLYSGAAIATRFMTR
jgi:CDP-diacylglycerol--glycerol-3-phosphate 3-phosphatidyltransferase